MTSPNSPLTRFRQFLAAVLEPCPDLGEAWCVNCSLHGGKTVVLSADGTNDHAREHAEVPGPGSVTIQMRKRIT